MRANEKKICEIVKFSNYFQLANVFPVLTERERERHIMGPVICEYYGEIEEYIM